MTKKKLKNKVEELRKLGIPESEIKRIELG